MNIYSILQLCGGLAFFLFGMHVMSGSLEKLAGGNLQKILKEVTSNPVKSLFFGAIVTIAIQSSSALTVMLVGLVNSGIMELAQTVGVIMGSNIGTTLTAWILSLSGIESDNLFISMLKPENFSPVIALIGVIMIMGSKKLPSAEEIAALFEEVKKIDARVATYKVHELKRMQLLELFDKSGVALWAFDLNRCSLAEILDCVKSGLKRGSRYWTT